MSDDDIVQFIDFIHCNYIESDRVIMTGNKTHFDSYFIGLSKPSFVSTLQENEMVACIASRLLHLFHNDVRHEIYFTDMVCIRRDTKKCHSLFLKLFYTHLFNQMSIEPNYKTFIF